MCGSWSTASSIRCKIPQPPPPLRYPRNSHDFTTQVFWDSDVGKWIEAASYALAHRRDAKIEAQIDAIVDDLAKAQLPDGYLNCWYIGREIDKRWTNLRDNHELYCAGHMLEGAIAYFQATGRRRLLDVMERYVDHIATVFGTGPGQKRGYCGHQEIELALIKLYHLTGDRRRLDLAAYFINERGRQPPHYFDAEAIARGDDPKKYWAKTHEYTQSHKPVREQDKVVGHAVRAMYMYTAMADLAAELDDAGLKQRLRDGSGGTSPGKRMYVTAGLGPAAANEGFTTDYDLPNDTAYAETCASVALIFWAQRMLNLDCDGAYADVLELALYNGALSGLSRDGTHYFYENKLESDGSHKRWEWHPCPCCTMNVARLVASVGGYFYSTGEDTLAVHLYGGNSARLSVGGKAVRIRQKADYPWSGQDRDRGRAGGAGRVHAEAPHPGLGARRNARRQRHSASTPCGAQPRLCRDPAPVVSGRPGRARPADAGRARLFPSRGACRYRPGGAEARTARLLRRGGRQSGAVGQPFPAAARRGLARDAAAGPVRRHRLRSPPKRRRHAPETGTATSTGPCRRPQNRRR